MHDKGEDSKTKGKFWVVAVEEEQKADMAKRDRKYYDFMEEGLSELNLAWMRVPDISTYTPSHNFIENANGNALTTRNQQQPQPQPQKHTAQKSNKKNTTKDTK